MLNKVILKGNIGRSPHFSMTQTGKEMARFFLATATSWKTKDGEWHTHTEWHRITILKSSTLRWMKGILKQGDTVYIEGKLSYHRWTDKFGQDHATPHIMITSGIGLIELIRHSNAISKPSQAPEEKEPSLIMDAPHDSDLLNTSQNLSHENLNQKRDHSHNQQEKPL